MQMWPGHIAGDAGMPDDLADLNRLVNHHADVIEMCIQRINGAMIDDDH